MVKQNYKKLLFRTAFCCMACDGDIDEREVDTLIYMDKHTKYFDEIDLSSELKLLLDRLHQVGIKEIEEIFQELRDADLSTVQELLLLEVALRIINADEIVEENEIKFIRYLRSTLKLHNETIMDRFGKIDYLFNKEIESDARKFETISEVINSFVLPELINIEKINLNDDTSN